MTDEQRVAAIRERYAEGAGTLARSARLGRRAVEDVPYLLDLLDASDWAWKVRDAMECPGCAQLTAERDGLRTRLEQQATRLRALTGFVERIEEFSRSRGSEFPNWDQIGGDARAALAGTDAPPQEGVAYSRATNENDNTLVARQPSWPVSAPVTPPPATQED